VVGQSAGAKQPCNRTSVTIQFNSKFEVVNQEDKIARCSHAECAPSTNTSSRKFCTFIVPSDPSRLRNFLHPLG